MEVQLPETEDDLPSADPPSTEDARISVDLFEGNATATADGDAGADGDPPAGGEPTPAGDPIAGYVVEDDGLGVDGEARGGPGGGGIGGSASGYVEVNDGSSASHVDANAQLVGFGILAFGVIVLIVALSLRQEAWNVRRRYLEFIGEKKPAAFPILTLVTLAIPLAWGMLVTKVTMPGLVGISSSDSMLMAIWYFPAYFAAGPFIAALIPTSTALIWFLLYSSTSTTQGGGQIRGVLRGTLAATVALIANLATLFWFTHHFFLSD
jgi:hypothetical protein